MIDLIAAVALMVSVECNRVAIENGFRPRRTISLPTAHRALDRLRLLPRTVDVTVCIRQIEDQLK